MIPEHLVSANFYFPIITDYIQLVAELISVNSNLSFLWLWWSLGQAPGKALPGFLAYFKKEIPDEKDPVLDQIILQDWWICFAHPGASAMFKMICFKEAWALYLAYFNPILLPLFWGLKTTWSQSLIGFTHWLSHLKQCDVFGDDIEDDFFDWLRLE